MMLLDLLMPEMNGFDVIQKLRTDFETQNIPVIVVTAKKVTEKDHQILSDQVQGLINKKGLTPQVLLQEVHRTEEILQGRSSR
jgi:CheY-like chemotaxis protein